MRIFWGIQPTGRKHLGNYLGAIVQYVAGQEHGDPAIYCVVDLHATTVAYDPSELRARLYDTAAILLAAGLNPARCVFFRQSDVVEHPVLTWLLSSVTAKGELERMHQFRAKTAGQRELASVGLFTYPVLMAADILAYRAEEVPVGDDQREHVELTRDVAARFNTRYGEGILTVPEARTPAVGARIMDLQHPEHKMSTTGSAEQGTVYVLDEPDAVARKVRRAATDSGSEVRRGPGKAGISNRSRSSPRCGAARPRWWRPTSPARATASSRPRSRRRSSPCSQACASATRRCAKTNRHWRPCWPRGRRAPGSCAGRCWPTCAPRWASAGASRAADDRRPGRPGAMRAAGLEPARARAPTGS